MKKLELPLHPHLETIFGYTGDAQNVMFYWDPTSGKLIFDDGLECGPANSWAYLIWAAHPSVKPFLPQSEYTFMLLERRGRSLYSLSREEALAALEGAGLPDLSQHMGEYAEKTEGYQSEEAAETISGKEAQQMLANFMVWLGTTAGGRKAA